MSLPLYGIHLALYFRMPYLPRYLIICDDSYFHVTWLCHNKDRLLQQDWAKKLYYNLLLKYKDRHGVEIYSYNLPTSEVGGMKFNKNK